GAGRVAGPTLGQRAGGVRRRVAADPLVLPGVIELLGVAARVVDGGQLADDLLAVSPAASRHFVGADVDLPLGSGPLDPAVRPGVLEREPLGRKVVGVTD